MGTVGSPYGLEGAVHVHSDADPDVGIFDYRPWILDRHGVRAETTALALGRAGGRLVARLDLAASLVEARSWTGATILVPRASLPPLPPGQYYLVDLPGLWVHDEEDRVLGTIVDVRSAPAQPLLTVRQGPRLRICPFVWDEVILAVDLEGGFVRIRRTALVD